MKNAVAIFETLLEYLHLLGPVAPTGGHQTTAVTGGEVKIQLSIIDPEIILIENPSNIDTNAVFLTVCRFFLWIIAELFVVHTSRWQKAHQLTWPLKHCYCVPKADKT